MADDISLKTVLDHLSAMEQRLAGRFDTVEKRFGQVDQKLQVVEANLTRQIDGIDRRLDEMEIQKLPSRVAALEVTVRR
jgi:hypothetical protein